LLKAGRAFARNFGSQSPHPLDRPIAQVSAS
jgi:hypothetical protein